MTKSRAKDSDRVPEKKIPALIGMQVMCGASGIAVLLMWAYFLWQIDLQYKKDLVSRSAIPLGVIAVGFLLAIIIAAFSQDWLRCWSWWILIACSIICAASSAAFIYVSGGAASPVVGFYIMTFSLTISNARNRHAFWLIGVFFAAVLLFVFMLDKELLWHLGHPIDEDTFKEISTTKAFYWAYAAGSLLSILIASLSKWWQQRKSDRTPSAPRNSADESQ